MGRHERWRKIQEAMSNIEDEGDVRRVRRMIEELPQDSQDRADLAHQLARVESGLRYTS